MRETARVISMNRGVTHNSVLHLLILRPIAPFGRGPFHIAHRILDLTRLAMDTIGEVHLNAGKSPQVILERLVDFRRTKPGAGGGKFLMASKAESRVGNVAMRRLMLAMHRAAFVDIGQNIEI